MLFFDGLSMLIPQKLLLKCESDWQANVARYKKFIEVGGIIVGTFDGKAIIPTDFVLDENASKSASYIQLSFDVLDKAERIAKERSASSGIEHLRVGTWHVHPPGNGCNFSPTDRNHLFMERILIKTDVPLAVYPQSHIIFAGDGKDFRAYSMCSMTPYNRLRIPLRIISFHRKELDSQIRELIKNGERTGLILKNSHRKTCPYEVLVETEKNYNQSNIIGFWKLYPYPSVPMPFETIFFENFYQKTNQKRFFYIRISNPPSGDLAYSSWVIARQRNTSLQSDKVNFVTVKTEII